MLPSNRRFPPAARRSLALLPLVLLGAACGLTDPDDSSLRAQIQTHRERWEARPFRDYAATLERQCFCLPAATEPVRIEVRQGQIVRRVDPETGEPVADPPPVPVPTVDGLFVILLEAVEGDAAAIELEWNAELGFPVRFFIDYDRQVADEELGFEVRDVEPLD